MVCSVDVNPEDPVHEYVAPPLAGSLKSGATHAYFADELILTVGSGNGKVVSVSTEVFVQLLVPVATTVYPPDIADVNALKVFVASVDVNCDGPLHWKEYLQRIHIRD